MGIGRRLALIFLLMVPVVMGPIVVSLWEIGRLRDANAAQAENVVRARDGADLASRLIVLAADLRTYRDLTTQSARRERRTDIEVGIAAAERALSAVRSGDAAERRASAVEEHGTALARLATLWRSGAVDGSGSTPASRSALDADLDAVRASTARASRVLLAGRASAATAAAKADDRHAHRSRVVILSVAMLGVVFGAVCLLWLARVVLPRTRRYADFAQRVAAGETLERISTDGNDELARLGRTLNEMVSTREREQRYVATQAEYGDALQMASSEEEAHTIIKLHLERSIPNGEAAVLNRNNSADRLELKTEMAADSPLPEAVRDAAPRSCLAIRFARPHDSSEELRPLLSCDVCGGIPGTTSCDPLLVGGEVIGSVLVTSGDGMGQAERGRLSQTVFQAAPVLANLRNLAIAELRAATDALTGLPNNRSVNDTVRRMAAHAGRTAQPLAAAMLDLDHFKQINDTFGHARGDDVLATVGAVLRETLRESDVVGRLGGEEFIMLLPCTDRRGAEVITERIRAAIATIVVPGVQRDITVSIGLAVIPDHAGDAEHLLREADRALYAAKSGGRNRVEVAMPSDAAHQRGSAGPASATPATAPDDR